MLPRRLAVVLTAAALLLAGLAAAVPTAARAAGDLGGGNSGSCGASGYPWGYDIACQSAGTTGGAPAAAGTTGTGTSGGAGTSAWTGPPPGSNCGLYPIAGNPTHMLQVCPTGAALLGGRNGLTLINATTATVPIGGAPGAAPAPAVTPAELLAWAQDELTLPLPDVQTARPRAAGGLVGLPEWFWVAPGQWKPVTARVAVGGVWAQVTAVPQALKVQPGDTGAGTGVSCDGPGVPPKAGTSPGTVPGSCTHTYTQSSDGLPDNAYQVTVTITWRATWAGSGGAGGALPALGRAAVFALPVAEAQALVTAPGA
jgi:hypothetical protein